MATLVARHDPAAQARYQALKQLALTQRRVLRGTPGTLKKRVRRNTEYWVREYTRVDGKKDDEHLGTVEKLSDRALEAYRHELELAKELVSGSSAMRLFGYQRVDRKVGAVMAALYNRKLVEKGLVLIGSHAYGALLNDTGAIAAGYRTQDIDLARGERLSISLPDELTFSDVLAESDLEFVPVPGMPSRLPSTSFKLPGAGAVAVDLLTSGATVGKVVPIDELASHAQTVPMLEFLIEAPVSGVLLGPSQVVPVVLPSPERFVVHKLYASQSRTAQREKTRKDVEQAAALASVLEEDMPGTLAETFRDFPKAGKSVAKRGALAASKISGVWPDALQTLRSIGST